MPALPGPTRSIPTRPGPSIRSVARSGRRGFSRPAPTGGYSTTYLAAAVDHLGAGHVHSFDLYPRAGRHLPDSLRGRVTLHLGRPATEALPAVLAQGAPDLFFQDSVHDYPGVLAELQCVVPCLPPHGVVLIHDFVAHGVRQAAVDGLPGYRIHELEGDDPQILGVAFRDRRGPG
ncbi:MAG: class I SAM-dependent methyltransferase [Verrucomicrobiota bacterium]